ncbi:haloacid dehalogenase type II [Arcobacter sp. LA11]|uniref:haloacid dehalogenase type II n=1 Tax=Arcobacter sp. LA11 TaxID=1898176 RepID=UPI0009332BE4|nr:haloacid dehalogenase type II [Arcobacter sp. LA11]
MRPTLAFDVYGTLIDTNAVVTLLEKYIKDKAQLFSQTWRDKQLEYSFRRGLMENYVSFAVCTAQALDYTCDFYKISLTNEQKNELLSIYKVLPAFDEVQESLSKLKAEGFPLYAFSNGKADAVEMLLTQAGIRNLFLGVVSVDDIETFKPSPDVYAHFLQSAKAKANESWLISGNPFDVTGSISAGMNAAWIQRSSDTVFDPWEIKPTMKVNSLLEFTKKINTI